MGVAHRRHHYERAFERHLRDRRIPYISVDEARKALLPEGARLGFEGADGRAAPGGAIKSFDFVVYAQPHNLLIDVKGRRLPRRAAPLSPAVRLECWATLDDIRSLTRWEQLFGEGFRAVLVYMYLCEAQPPDALFQDVLEDSGRWYALRAIPVDAYRGAMRVRSPRWGTVDLSPEDFERLSQPFSAPGPARAPRGTAGSVPSLYPAAAPG